MNAEELDRLLGKYYNGESTEEEERALRDHFKNGGVSADYEAENVIFGYYSEAGEVPEPSESFESGIMSEIDNISTREKSRKFRKYILPYLSAAAGMLILAGSWYFFVHSTDSGDTFKDPKIAYAETMKILMNVSTRLNRGTQSLEPVGKISEMTARSFKSISRSAGIIDNSLKNLENIQKAIELRNFPSVKNLNK
jgi:hypothetical protein